MTSNSQRGEQAMSQLDREIRSRDRAEKSKPLKVVAISAVAILAIVGGIWYATTRTGDDDLVASEETANQEAEAPAMEPLAMQRETPLAETVTCEYIEAGEPAGGGTPPERTTDVPTTGTLDVTLATNRGDIDLTLDRTTAPCTVNVIEHLADTGYYNDTVCHRLTTSGIHVLQCGDPTGTGAGGPGFQFANEYPTDELDTTGSAVIYPRGSIAMANAGQDTNGSQFFLNYDDSPLAPDYTYFGQISEEGLAVLDEIAADGVEDGAADGPPAEEVRIETATLG